MEGERTREAKIVSTHEPVVRTPQQGGKPTKKTHPHLFWQGEGKAPAVWHGRRPYHPCKRCGRVLTDTGAGAVMSYGSHGGKAYLACRHCGGKFTLPCADQSGGSK